MRTMNLSKRARLAVLFFILAALITGAYGLARLIFEHKTDFSLIANKVDSMVSANLAAHGIRTRDIRKNRVSKRKGKLQWEQIEVVVAVDESRSPEALGEALFEGLNLSSLKIVKNTKAARPSLIEHQLSVSFEDVTIYQLLIRQTLAPPDAGDVLKGPLPDEERPKIALIVDDVGYDLERALELLNLRRTMTISIFPKLKYSRHIAEVAHDMGYEVMMHLPMEPGEKLRRNPGFITLEMTEKEIRWVLDRNFRSVPFLVGVNNHQGSKMTRDPEAMARVMKYLAQKDVFFIDSRTTSDSIAYKTAKAFGLRAAENDVFLDNEKEVEYIKQRVEVLMQEARRKGKAIGVCHVHPATTQALSQMFPVIDEEGFELVFASELVE